MFCVLILFLCALVFTRGTYFLLSSPYVFRIDREKNYCTKEKKFFWQKEYKIKTLCKLSEVKEAIRTGGIFYNYVCLCLKLKSEKIITVFSEFYLNGFWSSKSRSANEFDKRATEINSFLKNNQNQYTMEKPLVYWGIFWILFGCILLTSVILILCNPV